ncbi:DUF423 domain-containing protein [Bradyrhizobium prioriisuperbiae]|uniref:DUF423 domain-containing protein n=1 Tax=Bradyrhizobium prioriisuperbiae TaxID=2854389 RepID=UPI0028F159E8|nr:DUF423 domain-containing protein [Bradyrhizobium prioritasuperba]
MSGRGFLRALVVVAGLFGAAGVVLAALSAHQPDATRLGSASTMLLFHATVIIGTVLLIERGLVQRVVGLLAAAGFVVGAGLFSGDLVLRQFAGHSLFPMAAPTGGTLLIVGWLVLAVAAVWPGKSA